MTDDEYELLKKARKDNHGMKILVEVMKELKEEAKTTETERE